MEETDAWRVNVVSRPGAVVPELWSDNPRPPGRLDADIRDAEGSWLRSRWAACAAMPRRRQNRTTPYRGLLPLIPRGGFEGRENPERLFRNLTRGDSLREDAVCVGSFPSESTEVAIPGSVTKPATRRPLAPIALVVAASSTQEAISTSDRFSGRRRACVMYPWSSRTTSGPSTHIDAG